MNLSNNIIKPNTVAESNLLPHMRNPSGFRNIAESIADLGAGVVIEVPLLPVRDEPVQREV